MIVAFDVDGVLIDDEDKPNWPVIDLLRAFKGLGFEIVVWSGGGEEYATTWTRRLGLEQFVSASMMKLETGDFQPYICFDDEHVELAHHNIRLSRRDPLADLLEDMGMKYPENDPENELPDNVTKGPWIDG